MFAVFGANGRTGGVVAKTLLRHGQKVRVVLRPGRSGEAWLKQGAEVVAADLQNADSIARALSGTKGAYALLPPDPTANDLLLHSRKLADALARACERNPVSHIVFLSSIAAQHPRGSGGAGAGGRSHYAEQRLSQTKSVFTLLRAALFMENIAAYAPLARKQGILPVLDGSEACEFPMVATEDVGRVAAYALLQPPSSQRIIELAGPEEYSFADIARETSAVLGREVLPTPLPTQGIVEALTGAGLSKGVAGLFREMTEAIAKGLIAFEGKGTLMRGDVTLKALVQRLLAN